MLVTVAWIGGQVLFAAHMLFESFRNEASVSAAWVFFWGLGYWLAQLIFGWTKDSLGSNYIWLIAVALAYTCW